MRSSCGIAMSLRKKLSSSILFWNATACGSPVATIPQIEPTTNAQNEAPIIMIPPTPKLMCSALATLSYIRAERWLKCVWC